jgi:hypothetical protein
MKPYGIDGKDRGCCPGHDKFPKQKYSSRRSQRAHAKANRIAHKRARARSALLTRREYESS